MDMNKQQVLAKINEIRSGSGIDRTAFENEFPDIRGELAETMWQNDIFGLGLEYGVIMGLIDAFGITADELGSDAINTA